MSPLVKQSIVVPILIGAFSAAVSFLLADRALVRPDPSANAGAAARPAQPKTPPGRSDSVPDISRPADAFKDRPRPGAGQDDPTPAPAQSHSRQELSQFLRSGRAFDPASGLAREARVVMTHMSADEIAHIKPREEDVLAGLSSSDPEVRAISAMFVPYAEIPWSEVERSYRLEQAPSAIAEFLRAFAHMPRSPEALELLFERTSDGADYPRQTALACLGYLNCDRSAAILLDACRHKLSSTRVAAYEALTNRATEERACLDAILTAAGGDLEPAEARQLYVQIEKHGLLHHLPPGAIQNLEIRAKQP